MPLIRIVQRDHVSMQRFLASESNLAYTYMMKQICVNVRVDIDDLLKGQHTMRGLLFNLLALQENNVPVLTRVRMLLYSYPEADLSTSQWKRMIEEFLLWDSSIIQDEDMSEYLEGYI